MLQKIGYRGYLSNKEHCSKWFRNFVRTLGDSEKNSSEVSVTTGAFIDRVKMLCAMFGFDTGAWLSVEECSRGRVEFRDLVGAVPKFRSCGGKYALFRISAKGSIGGCDIKGRVEVDVEVEVDGELLRTVSMSAEVRGTTGELRAAGTVRR